jgi:hypothetical protein
MKMKPHLLGGQLEHPGEILHTINKKIGRQGVSLPNSTFPLEEPMDVAIHCNRERSCGDTLHNKENKVIRKAKIPKKVFQEFPLDRIKSLSKIDF